ncbi:MAG: ATP-binding cassette domain-containing protein [Acidobacteriia bacterium]|nr:ATP-binding cassette domain-containing protein [Terriglobia bacterium]
MIEVLGLSKRYPGGAAVDDVSFVVPAGEMLALVGRSGSGKTTTLKMINRLVEPSAGRVRVDGEDVTRLEPHVLRRRIGYVFQGVGLFPHLTVGENVAVPLRLAHWEAGRIAARVAELLELVELDPALGSRRTSELSGGQLQRVGVARALAASPKVMLLDEPFGALDPITRDHVQRSFMALRLRVRPTAVFVTHDMAEALMLADRVGVMHAGRLLQVGTPSELSRAPADERVAQLLETPRRQARAIDALLQGPANG